MTQCCRRERVEGADSEKIVKRGRNEIGEFRIDSQGQGVGQALRHDREGGTGRLKGDPLAYILSGTRAIKPFS